MSQSAVSKIIKTLILMDINKVSLCRVVLVLRWMTFQWHFKALSQSPITDYTSAGKRQ